MTTKSDLPKVAQRMLTALNAAHWYLENVSEDDPNNSNRWAALRSLLIEAQEAADRVGIKADAEGYQLVMANDS